MINYPQDLRQAAHQARARRQINIGDANGPDYSDGPDPGPDCDWGPGPNCTGPDPPHDYCGPDPPWCEESYEDDEEITPYERKDKQYAHCNFRTGYLADLVNDEWDRKVFVDERYVVYQQSSAHDMDPHHIANWRTPEFVAAAPMPLGQTEPRREARRKEGPMSTSDTGATEVIWGAYGDWPLDVTARLVAPYPCYIVIDGGDGYLHSRQVASTEPRKSSKDGTATVEQSVTCERDRSLDASPISVAWTLQQNEQRGRRKTYAARAISGRPARKCRRGTTSGDT